METINLSERLTLVSSFIASGAYFADIGSDHAYLPIYVCQKDLTAKGIAGELNQGPYEAALTHVAGNQLTDRISVRKGNGLSVIEEEPVDTVVICGMGGGLIKTILDEGEKHLKNVTRLVLQPNIDSHYLRAWLVSHHYELVSEEILKEDGHIYEILVADKVAEDISLTDKAQLFGPFLLKQSSDIFKEKWQREKLNIERVIKEMSKAKVINQEKLQSFQTQLAWIKEVLKDDDTITD